MRSYHVEFSIPAWGAIISHKGVNTCGFVGFCPLCYEGAKGRRYWRGHFGYRSPRPVRQLEVTQVKKPISAVPNSNPLADDGFLAKERTRWPSLVEYLSQTKWDDGSPRETSTLMLLVEDGMLKACINDRALGRSLWVAADELNVALDAWRVTWRAGRGIGGSASRSVRRGGRSSAKVPIPG